MNFSKQGVCETYSNVQLQNTKQEECEFGQTPSVKINKLDNPF